MVSRLQESSKRMLLVVLLAGSMVVLTKASAQNKNKPTPPAPSTAKSTTEAAASAANWHAMNATYYKRKWGVDVVGIRLVSSGAMLRFSYRVIDPEKAKPLNDNRWNPYLVDEATGAKLGVPEMEKVGKLRQTGPTEEGRIYWMVFGNAGQLVKHGNRGDVVIGNFRADGIIVE